MGSQGGSSVNGSVESVVDVVAGGGMVVRVVGGAVIDVADISTRTVVVDANVVVVVVLVGAVRVGAFRFVVVVDGSVSVVVTCWIVVVVDGTV